MAEGEVGYVTHMERRGMLTGFWRGNFKFLAHWEKWCMCGLTLKWFLEKQVRKECTRYTWIRTEKCRAVVNTVTNFRVP